MLSHDRHASIKLYTVLHTPHLALTPGCVRIRCARALRVARQVESGVISINSHSSVHTEAPFGGFKRSGLGRDLGMSAMEACTEGKNIYVGE